MSIAARHRLHTVKSAAKTTLPQASLPANEAARLKTLYKYEILDTAPEKAFDEIAQLAALICATPIALVSLVDANRQWFKSKVGLEVTQTSRELAFCGYAILHSDILIVSDTLTDPRFAQHPLVTAAPYIRFYAGVPLITAENHALGTLCVLDRVPRELSLQQIAALQTLGHQVVKLLELRRNLAKSESSQLQRQQSGKSTKFFNRIAVGFGLASAILIGVGLVSYQSLTNLVQTAHLQMQKYAVLEEIKDIRSHIQAATIAKRRYLITAEVQDLEPYYEAAETIELKISQLRQGIAAQPAQQRHLTTLESLITRKLAEIKDITKLRTARGWQAASQPLLLKQAMRLTDDINVTVQAIEKTASASLQQESQAAKVNAHNATLAFSSGILLSLFVLAQVYYLIHREIFERQQVKQVLEQERDFIFAVLDTIASLVIVVDAQGRIVRFNRACEQISGYSLKEVKGKYFWQFCLPSEQVNSVRGILDKLLAGQFSDQYETSWVTRNGSYRMIAWSNTTLRDSAGTVEYVIASGIDITERALAAEALRSSEQHLRNVIDGLFTFVAVLTPDGILVEANQALLETAALQAEDVLGKPLTETYWWSYSPVVQVQLRTAIQRASLGDKVRYEVEGRVAKNQLIVIDFSLTPMFDAVGQVSYLIASGIDITKRKQAEAARQQANEQLSSWVNELKQRNREITLLSEISDFLQACLTVEEAYQAIASMMPSLFPDASGGLFLINASKRLVEPVATWGSLPLASQQPFTPHDCWALRRGQPHWVENPEKGLQCQHLHHALPAASLCIPMMGQGAALGVLYLCSNALNRLATAKQQLAVTVAEHIGLALANIKLRQTLQNQSIRDPLTSLFNRRYMEESLEREIQRCDRLQQPLSIIMIDVDYFKRFNDSFGHKAGDTVLEHLGQFLQRHVRGSDIACRYGGEEFMLILPEAALNVTQQRAEQIRTGVKHLALECCQQQIGSITLSLGVASYPLHGATADVVIRAADAALYRAKQEGRDRVITAVNQ